MGRCERASGAREGAEPPVHRRRVVGGVGGGEAGVEAGVEAALPKRRVAAARPAQSERAAAAAVG